MSCHINNHFFIFFSWISLTFYWRLISRKKYIDFSVCSFSNKDFEITIHQANLLRKPIIILLGSICEAVLYDFHGRIKYYIKEGVFGISSTVLDYIRNKKLDKFEVYIASAKKHELLGPKNDNVYDLLEDLRKLRNRIHIQNSKGHFDKDESLAFNETRQASAEKALEKMLKYISINHPRRESVQGFVADFQIPWKEHFSKL